VGQCPTLWPPCRIQVAPSDQRCKVCLTPTTRVPYSNADKTRNSLKLAGVPQTTGPFSAASGGSLRTILWKHVEEILLLNQFFPIVDTCLSCEDIARQSCTMVPRRRFLGPAFPASRAQHISDLDVDTLGPHDV